MAEPPDQPAPPALGAAPDVIDVFCSPERGGWRIYVRPTRLPRALRSCLDEHWEAVVQALDFDDLDRRMSAYHLDYEKRPTVSGSVELGGSARAAAVIAAWLSTAVASGIRDLP